MTLLPQEIIRRKRDGAALDEAEIGFLVRGMTDGSVSEGQIAAFAMAVYFNGMSMAERVALTRAMTHSGTILGWRDLALPGPVLDKHSTGGVGDKVSLMLAPIVAACGGFVPMISGRGLGHTGGTLDKLSAISGYNINPDSARFRRTVRDVGCAIIGQTDDLAPADRVLYAIRDVTATVESVPLITASILSKKLAAGLDGLVMDVKTGSGAFAATANAARELAESLVSVANGAGLKTAALITDMDQVLGRNVGNGVEVAEAIAYLTDASQREQRLHAVVVALASELLTLGGVTPNIEAGTKRVEAVLADGSAAETFARMVAALGGPRDLVERPTAHLPHAKITRPCPAPRSGYVVGMDTRTLGIAVIELGGGRRKVGDRINPAVGFTEFHAVGSKLAKGEPLAVVHADDTAAAQAAIATVQRAIRIGDAPPQATPVLYDRIGHETGGSSR